MSVWASKMPTGDWDCLLPTVYCLEVVPIAILSYEMANVVVVIDY
jgi:hypothetical protein